MNEEQNFIEAEARFKAAGVLTPPRHLSADTLVYTEEWIAACGSATRLDEIEMEFRRLQSEADFDRYVQQVADDCPF